MLKPSFAVTEALASENFLAKLLDSPSIFNNELKNRIPNLIEKIKEKNIIISGDLINKILFFSKKFAMKRNDILIDTYHVLLSILNDITLKKELVDIGITHELIEDILNKNGFSLITQKEEISLLSKFGRDLTQLARDNKLDPIIGREEELEKLITVLVRKNKNTPCLIGEAGVGKTAIVEKLAMKVVEGKVPKQLIGKTIFELDTTLLVAGATFRGQFEERMKTILEIIKKDKDIIVFIDEIHKLVGAGKGESNLDAATIMKPILARGEIKCIGATTLEEYRKYIEKDPALERRIQPIKVEEPNSEDTLIILKGIKQKLEKFHNTIISEEAIKAAVELSYRYITDRKFPDKAIDLLDEACSSFKLKLFTTPAEIEKLQRLINESIYIYKKENIKDIYKQKIEEWEFLLKKIKEYLKIKEKYDEIEKQLEIAKKEINIEKQKELTLELNQIEEKITAEFNSVPHKITENEVAIIVNKLTGIPVNKMLTNEVNKILSLKDKLTEKVIGQEEAIEKITDSIVRNYSGIKDPKRPIGVFLFIGPTGTGKTLLAKKIAEELFGSENNLIRIDMSEFSEKHNVSRLIGSPPGYVGYDDPNQFEKVRRNPYSLILFDEIEKAHKDVFNIFLQILEDGRLTDGQGRIINFKNTVIIMTSNIGTQKFMENEITEITKKQIFDLIKKEFRPEFINRIDDIIFFNKLKENELYKIIDLMLGELNERLSNKNITIKLTQNMKDKIIRESYSPEFGARPIRRYIEKEIETKIAYKLLRNEIKNGDVVELDDTENKEINGNNIKTNDEDEIPDDEFFKKYPIFKLLDDEEEKKLKKIKKLEEEEEEEEREGGWGIPPSLK